jgi:hypothetical protein
MEKYILVEHQNNKTFTELVNQKIAEGYVPLGGVAVYGNFYIQAMILNNKYDTQIY